MPYSSKSAAAQISPGFTVSREETTSIAARVPTSWLPFIDQKIAESGKSRSAYFRDLIEREFLKGEKPEPIIREPRKPRIKTARRIKSTKTRVKKQKPPQTQLERIHEQVAYPTSKLHQTQLPDQVQAPKNDRAETPKKPIEIMRINPQGIAPVPALKPDPIAPVAPSVPEWLKGYELQWQVFAEQCEKQNEGVTLDMLGKERGLHFFCPLTPSKIVEGTLPLFGGFNSQAILVSTTEGWLQGTEVSTGRSLYSQCIAYEYDMLLVGKTPKLFAMTGVSKEVEIHALDDICEIHPKRKTAIDINLRWDRAFMKRWKESGFDFHQLRHIYLGNGKESLSKKDSFYNRPKDLWVVDMGNSNSIMSERDRQRYLELPVFTNMGKTYKSGQIVNADQISTLQSFANARSYFDWDTHEWEGTPLGLQVMAIYRGFWILMPGMSQEFKERALRYMDTHAEPSMIQILKDWSVPLYQDSFYDQPVTRI